MTTVSAVPSHAAASFFASDVPEPELPLAGLDFDRRADSFSETLLGPLYQPSSTKRTSSQMPSSSSSSSSSSEPSANQTGTSSTTPAKETRNPFVGIKKRRSTLTSNDTSSNVTKGNSLPHSASINSQLKPSPSTSSNRFRSVLISPLLKPKSSSSSFHPTNLRSNSRSSHFKRSTSSRSNLTASVPHSASPVLELPPVQINASYQDLTQLFDDPYATMDSSLDPSAYDQSHHSSSNQPSYSTPNQSSSSRNPPKLTTSFSSNNKNNSNNNNNSRNDFPGLAPIKSISSEDALNIHDLPDYSYYTGNSYDDQDTFPDDSSIQASPVNTAHPFAHLAGKRPQSSNQLSASSFSNGGGMASTSSVPGLSQTTPNTSPILKHSNFSPSYSSSSLSPPLRNEASSIITPKQPTRNSLSAVAKVKSMFPGFASYKSLGKTSANTSPSTSPQLDDHSSFQHSNHSAFSFDDNSVSPSAVNSSFNLLHKGSPHSNDSNYDSHARNLPSSSDLPFSNSKPVQHFQEIDLGPTYKAKITPVKHSNSFRNGYSSAAANSSTRLTHNNSISSTNTSPLLSSKDSFPTNSNRTNQKYTSSERDQLLLQQVPADGESLDFVPNLRPHIDPVGSRLRSVGVPSPANLMMTKSQYDQYKKKMNTKKERKKSKDKSDSDEDDEDDARSLNKKKSHEDDDDDDEEDEEDEDDDEDDDYDDELDCRRVKRLEDEEEAKKQNIRMRLRQDAHLAVYRQKMTKVTGSQIGLTANGNNFPSSTNLLNGLSGYNSDDSDDEYDDVPLGILKAHGFPTAARLNKTNSQPNLLALNPPNGATSAPGTPGVMADLAAPLLAGDKALLRPLGDSQSVRSFGSPIRSNTPAPEEGYLAMRNPSNLPTVFGASIPMNRGLIGEIAKEEEAKLRRKSVMNNLARDRTNTLMDQIENSSIYNQNNGSNTVAGQPLSNGLSQGGGEIQFQLSQMMQLQTQILQQMQYQSQQPTLAGSHMSMPLNSPVGMGGFASSMPYSTPGSQFTPKHWSSFDVMGGAGPMMRPTPAAPSIRSYSPSINGSVHSGNEPSKQAKSQTPQPHQHSYSTTSFKFPNNRGTTIGSFLPIQPPVQAQQYHAQQAMQGQQGSGTDNYSTTPASSRLVLTSDNTNNSNDDDDDDDDDDADEAGWKEMENRRKTLKDMWKSSPSPAIVS